MRCRRSAFVITIIATVVQAGTVRAQQWAVDLYAGRSLHEGVSADVGSTNGVLGVRYLGGRTWAHASAATPLSTDDPAWGAGGIGGRFEHEAALFFGALDAGVDGYIFRDPVADRTGSGVTAELVPLIGVRRHLFAAEAGTGLIHHLRSYAGESDDRTLHDSRLRITYGDGLSALVVAADGRVSRAEGVTYTFAGASAGWRMGALELSGSVGSWFQEELPGQSWSLGARLSAGPRTEIWAAVMDEATDPLYLNPRRRSWNLGVTRRMGPAPRIQTVQPAEVVSGRVTIRLPADEAEAPPAIAGDFTNWEPVLMSRSGDSWVVTLSATSGVHHYAFRSADGTWFVPDSVPGRQPDGFGGFVAVLVVP